MNNDMPTLTDTLRAAKRRGRGFLNRWGQKPAPEELAVSPAEVEVEHLQESDEVRRRKLDLNSSVAFTNLCNAARSFWPHNVIQSDEKIILVDLMTQDLRVHLRALTIANGIRRAEGATLVGIINPDPMWQRVVWDYYDVEATKALAEAYGVTDFIDVAALVDAVAEGETVTTVAGRRITIGDADLVEHDYIASEARSTVLRILRRPRFDDDTAVDPDAMGIMARAEGFARVYSSLFRQLPILTLIVSHVDYTCWGYGVHASMNADVPVIHLQSTGGVKAYAWFPESATEGSYRAQMTQKIGEYFDRYVWANRDQLRRSAEITAYRARHDYGRPSWWRSSGQLAIHSAQERSDARAVSAHRLRIPAQRAVVAVFAHAFSDALGSNVEVFDDFVDWLDETAALAAEHPEVTWLFVDHPTQFRYDTTDYFDQLRQRYAGAPHMLFIPSLDLEKNELWSLVDLAVTVRGSVSNEYPAFGVPAIQAGWSEWSHCGVSKLAKNREEYRALLLDGVQQLTSGGIPLDKDVVERARLWGWFYKALADVDTAFVPHWNVGYNERALNEAATSMRQIETMGDRAFAGIGRMWRRREAILTRLDMDTPEWHLNSGQVQEPMAQEAWGDFGLNTAFDVNVQALTGAVSITSGETADLTYITGAYPGVAVVGRCEQWQTTFGIRYDSEGHPLSVRVRLTVDQNTKVWQERKLATSSDSAHTIDVYCQGSLEQSIVIGGLDAPLTDTAELTLHASDYRGPGLLIVRLVGRGGEASEEAALNLVGVQIDCIEVDHADETSGSAPTTALRPESETSDADHSSSMGAGAGSTGK